LGGFVSTGTFAVFFFFDGGGGGGGDFLVLTGYFRLTGDFFLATALDVDDGSSIFLEDSIDSASGVTGIMALDLPRALVVVVAFFDLVCFLGVDRTLLLTLSLSSSGDADNICERRKLRRCGRTVSPRTVPRDDIEKEDDDCMKAAVVVTLVLLGKDKGRTIAQLVQRKRQMR
jgi:hypothetical protein